MLVFSSVKVNANHSENPNSCQTQTNIKLITAVAIDTNTCYLSVAGLKKRILL